MLTTAIRVRLPAGAGFAQLRSGNLETFSVPVSGRSGVSSPVVAHSSIPISATPVLLLTGSS